jgi:putative DNA-invertase from lambdoid prophage Rac
VKAALYLRVSTDEQTTENQRAPLETMARARGFTELELVVEVESGARRRPKLEHLLERARRGEVMAIFVWALDRVTREGVGSLVPLLERLERHGVELVSYSEPWLDTAGPAKDLILAMLAWAAQQERRRLVERTRAGLERARREGKTLGRPSLERVLAERGLDVAQVAHLVRLSSVSAAARSLKLSRPSIRRALELHREQAEAPATVLELAPVPRRRG